MVQFSFSGAIAYQSYKYQRHQLYFKQSLNVRLQELNATHSIHTGDIYEGVSKSFEPQAFSPFR